MIFKILCRWKVPGFQWRTVFVLTSCCSVLTTNSSFIHPFIHSLTYSNLSSYVTNMVLGLCQNFRALITVALRAFLQSLVSVSLSGVISCVLPVHTSPFNLTRLLPRPRIVTVPIVTSVWNVLLSPNLLKFQFTCHFSREPTLVSQMVANFPSELGALGTFFVTPHVICH